MNYPTTLLRGLLLALAITFVAPLTGTEGGLFGVEAAQAQTVRAISIDGNTRVDDATVLSYLSVRVGDNATNAAINSSIEALHASGLFSNVSVTLSGSTLVVRVSENPIVASVLFEGNQRFSDAQLLTMVNVGSRGTFSQERLAADEQSIRMAYEQQGFNGVTVTSRVEQLESARTRVTFVINEGGRAGIAAINFTGNNTFGPNVLKGVIATKESHLLSFLFRDDTYDEAKLQVDRELIRLYYANHGFPDTQVTSAVAEFDASRNAYFVNFTIVEGERYSFGAVDIETSIAGLNTDALRWSVRTREGDGYKLADLQRTTEDMAAEATDQGFPFADVRPRIDRDVANRRFNITYLVDNGARVYVERINITGNQKTRDFVIRRELEFAEGDPFNRSMVARGKSNIERLGFFQVVNVTTEPGSATDRVIINVAVTETSTGDYGVSLGYSTADGILGEVSLTERNFLGRGQYLRVAVGATAAGQTFDLSFTEPRFMGLRVSAGIDAYHRINEETETNYYGYTATGGQVRFGIPITRDLTASLFTGFEQKTLVDERTLPEDGDDDDALNNIEELEGRDSALVNGTEVLNKGWIGYSLSYNTLDNAKRPTEGLYANFTQGYYGIDHNFIKTEARARYFHTLVEDWGIVGSVRGTAGILNDLSGDGIHPTEAFFKGSELVRGFQPRDWGPRLDQGVDAGEVVGATAYAGASAEVEFPLPILPETYGLRGAVWGDIGMVTRVDDAALPGDIDPDSDAPFRASVGASIIWDSPFGPLRGDFAHVLAKADQDETQVFQLSISNLL